MIKRLSACIREYRRDTILTPLLMIGEVVCECIIPLYTAQLVNQVQAGCSRDVITRGAEQLGWELDTLIGRTLAAMQATEADVAAKTAALE